MMNMYLVSKSSMGITDLGYETLPVYIIIVKNKYYCLAQSYNLKFLEELLIIPCIRAYGYGSTWFEVLGIIKKYEN